MADDTFNDWSTALRAKEVIAKVVREEMTRQRPPARYGKVVGFNRFNMTARVTFPGDLETTSVKFPLSLQPVRSIDLGFGDSSDVVRVEGTPGNLWITEIVNGRVQEDGTRLNSPSLMGGRFMHEVRARHFAAGTSALPGQDEAWYAGRWKNTASFGADGAVHLDIVIQQSVLVTVIKHYSVTLRSNDTQLGWRKVASSRDSGPWSGNDFELELKTTSDGVEFRVRRTKWNTGFTPGGYDMDIWFYGKEWERDYSAAEFVTADPAPTRFVGTTSVDGKGPFVSPALHIPNLAQRLLTGGGAVSYVNAGGLTLLKWSSRFIIIGMGRNHLSTEGYFTINVPVGGVTVPVYGKNGATTTTTVAGGIWLTNWQALYYEIPWGGDSTFNEANFRIVDFDDTAKRFQVPSHWVFVAVKLDDGGSEYVQMGNGDIIDWAHPLSLSSGFGIIGLGWAEPAWRADSMGRVSLEGLVSITVSQTAPSQITVLPPNARPGSGRYFVLATNAGFARVEVFPGGAVNLQTSLLSGSWISLDGISFPRAQ